MASNKAQSSEQPRKLGKQSDLEDEQVQAFLRQALSLAEKGRFTCQPNPMVGCVLAKAGQVIGQGFHQRAGANHAEINALEDAKQQGHDVRGASAYVSLEPCSHFGKTPPCANALVNAGIKVVVYACEDPNPLVAGKGQAILLEAGVSARLTKSSEIQAQAKALNRAFFHRMQTGRPWVLLKVAATLDGRTADSQGVSQWITGAEARADVQCLRAASGAVLTGSGTQQADDPSLNVRLPEVDRQPYRVLLDSDLSLSPTANIIGDDKQLIVFTNSVNKNKINGLKPNVHSINTLSAPIQLSAVLEYLADLQVNQLMVEAGATLAGAFLEAGLVDEMVYYLAPSVLGSGARGAFDLTQPLPLEQRQHFSLQSMQQVGDDVRLNLYRAFEN